MSDLVVQLRHWAEIGTNVIGVSGLLREAAAEIERLRAEVEAQKDETAMVADGVIHAGTCDGDTAPRCVRCQRDEAVALLRECREGFAANVASQRKDLNNWDEGERSPDLVERLTADEAVLARLDAFLNGGSA